MDINLLLAGISIVLVFIFVAVGNIASKHGYSLTAKVSCFAGLMLIVVAYMFLFAHGTILQRL